jgi:hypothetical protein
MSLLPDLSNALTTATTVACGELGLVIGPRAERLHMLELSAVLALRGRRPGAGWRQQLQCAVRGPLHPAPYTVQLEAALNRITVARAFTCYQMVTLLQETAVSPAPTLVLDLLATFGDESIDLRMKACGCCAWRLVQLQRLCRLAPVVVSLQPLHQPERAMLTELVMNAATHHFVREMPETAVSQPSLFSWG